MLKKLFNLNKNIANNQKGSVLSVALIVITILTFSISTITNLSINLAGQTNIKLESVNNEITGKALIDQSIAEFQQYIRDSGADYTNFYNVEVPRILSDYGVVVTDVTIDEGITDPNSKAYKFAYTYQNGSNIDQTIFKISYASLNEIATVQLNPFDFQIGTNGDVLMAGGYYEGLGQSDGTNGTPIDLLQIFGDEVYITDSAPYVDAPYSYDYAGSQDVTPNTTNTEPTFIDVKIFEKTSYEYCSGTSCFTTNGSNNPFVIRNDSVNVFRDASQAASNLGWDIGQTTSTNILDFFGDFDFNQFIIDFMQNEAPTDSTTLPSSPTITWANLASTIMANSTPVDIKFKKNGQFQRINWPNGNDAFYDLTDAVPYMSSFQEMKKGVSYVYEGDLNDSTPLTISSDWNLRQGQSFDTFVVIDDLVLDQNASGSFRSDLVVFGDLYLEGGDKDFEGSVIVFGDTYMNFNSGSGIVTSGENQGFTLLSKGDIHLISHHSVLTSNNDADQFSGFFYTEESIFIDAVNARLNLIGSLFARASGNSSIYLDNENNTQFNGIVINSYYGFVNNGVANEGGNSNAHRFRITKLSKDSYQDRFRNIPVFNTLIQQPSSEPNFYTTDFDKE